MPAFTTLALAILPLVLAPWPPATAAQQPPSSVPAVAAGGPSPRAIEMQLATVIDHAETLTGQLVQLMPARVTRVVSATLVEVRDLREESRYHFLMSEHDTLLVLLPPGASVASGQAIALFGVVRTVRGARMSGELTAASDDVLKHHRNALLLVASHAETVDRVDLAGRR